MGRVVGRALGRIGRGASQGLDGLRGGGSNSRDRDSDLAVARLAILDERLHKILENTHDLICIVDPNMQVVVVNRALSRVLGLPPRKAIGEKFVNWLGETGRASFEQGHRRALAGQPIPSLEIDFKRPDGDRAKALVSLHLLNGRRVERDAVLVAGQDLTQIGALQNQVIHAEKLSTLGKLVAGVAHELNNPLTSITVYADFLLKKFSGLGQVTDVEMLQRISHGAQRIQSFSRELVTYARPAANVFGEVDLNAVVDQAVSFCEHGIRDADAELAREFEASLPTIWAVQQQLQQVLINLITNACDALPKGGGQLCIRTANDGEGMVRLEVEDGGMGMDNDHLAQIFEPFFTSKLPGKGTGLGLSIVKNIIEGHKGRIEVGSERGKGTKFIVRLPIGQ